jgi:hypothetical protein
MKKIGFIDYFLDEWHANNFPTWIRQSSYAERMDLAFAWAERDKEGGLTTDAWCQQHRAARLASLEEVVEKSDYLIVLSPDHAEKHESLAHLALASGKPVYVDKTFAPDLATAKRMVARAREFSTPMLSSSALRFAEEIDQMREKVGTSTIHYVGAGGPGSYATYAVHQLEMIVAILGPGARRIKQAGTERAPLMVIEYGDGRRARLEMIPDTPFNLTVRFGEAGGWRAPAIDGKFFPRFMEGVLRFFDTGQVPVPPTETLTIMALIEAGKKALAQPDSWIDVAG